MAARVLIAGAGVAALEAALALRALAEERVDVDLVGAEPHFWYRPLSVAEPFELGEVRRHELAPLAAAAGARFTLGTLLGVDASSRTARTSVGDIPYDFLLVAVGATRSLAVPGALTFRGPAESERVGALLGEIDAGDVRRVAFVVPTGAVWSLPLYELALMTAAHVTAQRIRGVELVFVTPESAPLETFGGTVSAEVRQLLDAARSHFARAPVPSSTGTACSGSGRKASSRSTGSSPCRDCAAGGCTGFLRLRMASSRSTQTVASKGWTRCTRRATSSTSR